MQKIIIISYVNKYKITSCVVSKIKTVLLIIVSIDKKKLVLAYYVFK